jgi:organic hydroperoxide reductase OsmC/OhrA
MTTHHATIHWSRAEDAPFIDRRYARAHRWSFDGGAVVPGSSSPHVVKVPLSDPSAVDPEEAYVAALASCHMLWFLDFASRKGYVVDDYRDEATATMDEDAEGRTFVARVLLDPAIAFSGAKRPDEAAVSALHEEAHHHCFLANSVKTEIVHRGTWTHDAAPAIV